LCFCLLALVLAACSQTATVAPSRNDYPSPEALVGDVALVSSATDPAESALLDVGVVIFQAAPVDPDTAQVSEWLVTEIREKETHYLPFVLRNTLLQSNQWGAVRVLPQEDPTVDVSVRGTILRSDGLTLELHLSASDSTGRVWLDRTYGDETSNRDYRQSTFDSEDSAAGDPAIDPFQDLYARIANDLLALRDSLTEAQLAQIRQVSLLRYAVDLSPQTFSRMLTTDGQGYWQPAGLPAADDPMLGRVGDMRLRHHLFIDTVDTYYESLHDEMQPLYDLWRQYSHEQILETRERVPGGRGDNTGSGIEALTQSYNRYKWAKIYEQEFAALAQGFNNEIAPAILELNRRVHGLSGSLEEQYTQWRDILRQLFEVETGLTSSDQE
jgi:hypothetical protein